VVRYTVEQGNTVFLVSWKNVQADLGHLTWDDYIEKGALQAIKVVQDICKIKTRSMRWASASAAPSSVPRWPWRQRGESPVASLTLLTTLLDFADSGEIGCLVDETAVQAREATIGKGGLLRGSELAQVFSSCAPTT
jgi:polyhydroxyalkanoate synthase